MARVFISYSKRSPKPTTEVAGVLEAAGHDVWWDTALLPGETFRETIDRELDDADVVIVIWTPESIRSSWVQAEADHALAAGKLLPLLHGVEPREIPKPFGTLHTEAAHNVEAVLAAVARRAGAPMTSPESPLSRFFGRRDGTSKATDAPSDALPTWDLSSLVPEPAEPAIDALLDGVEVACREFAATYRGRIADLSPHDLLAAIRAYEEIDERCGRIMSYRGLRYHEETGDDGRGAKLHDTQARIEGITSPLIFFALELNATDPREVERKASALPELAWYLPHFRRLRAFQPYQFSEAEELALRPAHRECDELRRRFDAIMSGLAFDMDYGSGYAREKLPLPNALNRLRDGDRKVRAEAFRSITTELKGKVEDLTAIQRRLISLKAEEDRRRRFDRPDASRHLADELQGEWVDAMEAAVTAGYARTSHEYHALKACWLGLERLSLFDRVAPLPFATDLRLGWPEARDVVLEAFGEFAPRLRKIALRFFDEGWIDASQNPTRTPGAFCHPTVPSSHPFVLVNFWGGFDDLLTLAGMLGHGVYQYLARRQGTLMSAVPHALSSAISSFFETLVFERFLARSRTEHQRFLLATFVESRLNTIERQVAFNLFERRLHEAVARDVEIGAPEVGRLWCEVQAVSLGPAVDLTAGTEVLWSYVPHFIHSPFIVSGYAYGGLLSSVMYASYLEDRKERKPAFPDRMIELLEAGGTRPHLELLRSLDIDVADPATWSAGIDLTAQIIAELKAMDAQA